MILKKAIVSALCLCLTVSAFTAQVVNRAIATVNGDAVLLSEFEKNWKSFIEQQKETMPPDQITDDWKKNAQKKILDQMVDDKVLLQEAKKSKVRINQRDLENGVIQVKARFLPDEGKRQIDKLVQKAVADLPQPKDGPPPDVSAVDLSAIWKTLAKSNPDAVKQAEDKFKEEMAKEGLSDKKFQDRIRDQLSVMQLSTQEVRSRVKLPQDSEVKNLYDQVVKVMDNKLDLKKMDPEDAADLQSMARYFESQTGERVRARHILIQVKKDATFMEKSTAKRKAEDIRKRIMSGDDFADAAEKFSDDKASAVRGGDLGTFSRSQMVPGFEKVAFSLPVGQISDVVETDFGYHIIKVEEKKAASKLKFEDVQDDLKNYLMQAQRQKAFEDYVKTLRSQATVKVDIDLDKNPID